MFLSGGPFQGPDDVIIDDISPARTGAYAWADKITIMNQRFRISGIVEHGKGGRKLLPITPWAR